MIGTRLGPYEILQQLGAGGMGEVWLAQDARLGRRVAIKVLPEPFATDPERLARFEQEARAAAALNHPNIAAVFDVGAEGEGDGRMHYMVQEYLQGHSLRTVLAQGALDTPRALALAIEIAEALKAAHDAGIVHRDLKPDNIFVSQDGHAKVLDFGLAKLAERPVVEADALTRSPTALATAPGLVMGTAGYMAPEQARGESVDTRADLFALGCVLWEMLTGRRAFDGDSVIQVLNRVLYEEPRPLGEVASGTSAELRRIVAKCLRKRVDERYQGAGDLVVDLRALAAAPPEEGRPAAAPAVPDRRRSAARGAAAVTAIAILSLLVGYAARTLVERERPPAATVADLRLPLGVPLDLSFTPLPMALSPDGQSVVFEGIEDGRVQLYRRDLAGGSPQPIAGTEDGAAPFFSPDGRWLGFHSSRHSAVMKVSLGGGAPSRIAPIAGYVTDASWGVDDTIVFSSNSSGLRRVSAAGGEVDWVTQLGEGRSHTGARYLPGERQVLFAVSGGQEPAIEVVDLADGRRTPLGLVGHSPFYLEAASGDGYLVYLQGSTLVAQAFDSERLEVTGVPVEVLGSIGKTYDGETLSLGMSYYAGGNLLHLPPHAPHAARGVRVTRAGEPIERPTYLEDAEEFSLDSADTRMSAVSISGRSLNVFDLRTGKSWPLTAIRPSYTALSPDGSLLAYSDDLRLHLRAADGSDAPRQLLEERDVVSVPRSWSPDGGTIYFYKVLPQTLRDIWTYRLADGTAAPLIVTEFDERAPAASPAGKWLAYVSDRGGSFEVWVIDVDAERPPRQVSRAGGGAPAWSRDGAELFFRSDDGWIMSARFDVETGLAEEPRRLFEDRYIREQFRNTNYVVGSDGSFLFPERMVGEEIAELNLFVGFGEWVDRQVRSRQ